MLKNQVTFNNLVQGVTVKRKGVILPDQLREKINDYIDGNKSFPVMRVGDNKICKAVIAEAVLHPLNYQRDRIIVKIIRC